MCITIGVPIQVAVVVVVVVLAAVVVPDGTYIYVYARTGSFPRRARQKICIIRPFGLLIIREFGPRQTFETVLAVRLIIVVVRRRFGTIGGQYYPIVSRASSSTTSVARIIPKTSVYYVNLF